VTKFCKITHMGAREIIRISEFGGILFRAKNYFEIFQECSCNLRHWDWLETINNYISIMQLVIWSLNIILGVKCANMDDFPKLGHKINVETCNSLPCYFPQSSLLFSQQFALGTSWNPTQHHPSLPQLCH